jgi:hypothetical protein
LKRAAAIAVYVLAACGPQPSPTTQLTLAQLEDPASCQACHPTQFSDWQGSMHAYSSEDPVFLAMNARGQRETDGGLGTFCIQCHAPMAVQTGASTDGLNLASLAQPLHGVTCFFCHSVTEVTGAHDNPLVLSFDGGLRGSIKPPEPPLLSGMPHGGVYSAYLDSANVTSATMCGACHDIVNGHGAAIERTFAEWQASIFSQDTTGGETCNQCHMLQSNSPGPISTLPGSPARELHAHTFSAIDIALVPFPDAPAQSQAVQAFLDTSLATAVCVDPMPGGRYQIQVYLDNVAAGHKWPSGADQDRRPWVQVVVTGADGGVIYQSGVVPPGAAPTQTGDPDMWMLRDCMFGADGGQVDMFWQAYSSEGNELPNSVTFDPTNLAFYSTHVVQTYPRATPLLTSLPAQITMQVYFQPVGLDVLNDLVASGDLDAGVVQAMPTYTVGPMLTWTPAAAAASGIGFADPSSNQPVTCVSYNYNATSANVYGDPPVKVAAPKANCGP